MFLKTKLYQMYYKFKSKRKTSLELLKILHKYHNEKVGNRLLLDLHCIINKIPADKVVGCTSLHVFL